MKKKYLLTLLPLISLVGCAGKEAATSMVYEVSHELGIVSVRALSSEAGEGTHVTYLMMSRYGRLTIGGQTIAGGDYEPKFYENCIVYKSGSSDALPDKTQVSHTKGAEFRGWVKYNDNTYPDYYTNVPSASGETLMAIFDKDTGSGGGGGGGGEPATSYTVTIQVDLSIFSGWEGISNFSVYVWGSSGEEQFGNWDACAGNLKGDGNVKSITKTVTGAIVGAIFYFDQTGGDYPGRKQTTDMTINIREEGTYGIAPTGAAISYNSEGKMTNFTISKIS